MDWMFRNKWWAFLVGLYLVTRLANLTLLPIFTDESNYLNWGWLSLHGQPFYSLFDAKQPGLIWMFGLFGMIFPNPLLGARLVSVITGLINLLAIKVIAKKLFDEKTSWWAGLLYVITPLFVFYDRQALMESSLISISLWVFYLILKLWEKGEIKTALIIGVILGIGFWIKSSVMLFIVGFIFVIVTMSVLKKERAVTYLTGLVYAGMVFGLVIFPLVMQPELAANWSKNKLYSLSVSQLLTFPWKTWGANIAVNIELWILLLSPVILSLGIGGLVRLIKERKEGLLFLVWLVVPIWLYLITAKFTGSLFQRYSTPLLPLLLITAANVVLDKRYLRAVAIIFPIVVTSVLIVNPVYYFHAFSHISDYSYIQGYVTGIDTGYQVDQIMSYMDQKAKEKPILVGLQPFHFNPTAGVAVYSRKKESMKPVYIDFGVGSLYEKFDCLLAERPIYLIQVSDDLGDLERFFIKVDTVTNDFSQERNNIYTLKSGCPVEKTTKAIYYEY